MIGSEQHAAAVFRAHVAQRRAVTGERFANSPNLHPDLRAALASIDNRWPLAETIVSPLAVCDVPETIVSPAAAVTLETGVSPWIAAGISRATWYRRRGAETPVSRAAAGKPWEALGVSRASWYRRGKSSGHRGDSRCSE
jgi:hypothetical protein